MRSVYLVIVPFPSYKLYAANGNDLNYVVIDATLALEEDPRTLRIAPIALLSRS